MWVIMLLPCTYLVYGFADLLTFSLFQCVAVLNVSQELKFAAWLSAIAVIHMYTILSFTSSNRRCSISLNPVVLYDN
jgi:hypothetical protein